MGQGLKIVGGKPPLDMDFAAFHPAKLWEALLKCCAPPLPFRVRLRAMHQDTEAPHSAALLCARRERPCRCRTATQRDELAAFHAEHGDFLPVVWRLATGPDARLPHAQPAAEQLASPSARPELL